MTAHLAPTHIVGIEASAGGLAALEEFFKAMPDHSGMAFVLVQHGSPDVASLMDDLLARNTRMPIQRVENGMELTANAIYLIPPRQAMTVTEGHLYLQERVDQHPILPIDSFFESLASAAQNRAIGIILSGTGPDGARGIQAIHEAGGLVLVRSIQPAQFDGLPPAACRVAPFDYVTSPAEMPALLLEYVQKPDGVRAAADESDKDFSCEPLDRQTLLDYEQVISRLVHAGVLLDAQFQVLRYFGAIGQYLKAPAGEPMVDIAQIVADDLHPALSEALQQAATRKERFSLPGVVVEQGETVRWVDLSVDCIPDGKTSARRYLVTLTPAEPPELLSSLEVGVLFLDANLAVRRFNPASAAAFELMPQDIGRPIARIACRLTDQAAMLSSLRQVLETGQAVETEVQARNGIWLIQRMLPYLNSRQEITGVILTFTDVTRLKNDQARLRTLFDLLPVGAAIFDRGGNVIEANRRSSAITALNQGGQEPHQTLRVDGTEMPADELAAARVLRTHQPVYDVQTGFIREDGSLVWANVSAAPLPDGSVVVVTADTTGSKQSADTERSRLLERLDLAAHAAGIGIWDWDIQKNEIVWDDQMYALYGLQPGGSGRAYDAWLQGVHPDDRASSDEISTRAVRGEAKYDTEFRVLWPDGSVHWLKADGEVFRDQDGKPTRMVGVNFDITGRKELEESLRDSERKYALLFEKSAVPTVLLRLPEVVIADVNEACEKLTGFTRAEMIGKTSVELGLTRKEVREETIASFKQTGALVENEILLFAKSGELRIVIANTTPVSMSEGMYAITTMQDITSRTQAESALQRSERLLNETGQIARIGGWELDIASMKQEWTDATYEIHDRARDVYDPNSTEELSRFEPGSKERIENAFEEAFRQGTPYDLEVEMTTVKGNRKWVRAVCSPIMADGKVTRLAGTVQDITERKQAEENLRASEAKFRAVFDNAPVGISLLDAERNLLESNDMLAQMVRMEKAGLASGGYRKRRYIRQDGSEFLTSELASSRAIAERRAVRDVVNGIVLEDGEIIWTQVSAAPLGAGDSRFVVITQDITERKRVEDELRRSNAELEQFAYIASHDLQEPLRTVAGMVQLLQQRYQGQIDERADEYIQFAVDASNRMQQLINDLLDFSRVDRKERSFAATDMEQVLQRALANLQSAITESGAQITADSLPTVQADAEQLTQVLQNLVGNAIKFRGEQPLAIHIAAEKTGNGWQFAVRDNGIGIDPLYFERVFLIFQRLHTRRKYPGTGIGLALCKKIIERHGGKIWVQSELNHGATFFFTLPERSKA